MSRVACLSIVLASLVAAPGCNGCFGGFNCRRPSFLEFGSPCGAGMLQGSPGPACGAAPCGAQECGSACPPAVESAAPCCDGAVHQGGAVMMPAGSVGALN